VKRLVGYADPPLRFDRLLVFEDREDAPRDIHAEMAEFQADAVAVADSTSDVDATAAVVERVVLALGEPATNDRGERCGGSRFLGARAIVGCFALARLSEVGTVACQESAVDLPGDLNRGRLAVTVIVCWRV